MTALAPASFPAYFALMNRIAIALQSMRRESANGNCYAIHWFLQRFHLRFTRRHFPRLPAVTSADRERPITVVIPAADKDADLLGHCLQSVRENVDQMLTDIWVVAPESEQIRAVTAQHRARFVHEDTILPEPARELRARGWVLQQFIKLNAANHVTTDQYLVLDSDTLFLRPQHFFRSGKAVLRYSDQYELLYNRSLELVFGHRRRFPVSFVTHHALFSREVVRQLLSFLESRFDRPWWIAIQEEVDKGHLISFSEYELYGNFVVNQPGWRKRVVLEYWNGLDLDGTDLPELDQLRAGAGPRCNSLSFHRHTQ